MNLTRKVLKAATISVALLGCAAVVATVAMPDSAYAGNGKGKGEGKGGGNGKGGKSDNGKGYGASAKGGKSDKAKSTRGGGNPFGDIFKSKKQRAEEAKQRKAAKIKREKPAKASPNANTHGNKLASALGVHPSELGALNAANASPQALANASPNSRVGKIAIYAEEVSALQDIEADLAAAQDALDGLEAPQRSIDEIDMDADARAAEKAFLEAELATLQADLAAAGGTDDAIEANISDVTDAIDAADAELTALSQERADAEAYATAADEVTRYENELAVQEGAARSALEDAANKEVTDEVEATVRSMLGLDTEPVAPEDDLAMSAGE